VLHGGAAGATPKAAFPQGIQGLADAVERADTLVEA
jgi:hypothetical protein